MNIQPIFDTEEVISPEKLAQIWANPETIEEFIPIVARFRRLKPLFQAILLQVLEIESRSLSSSPIYFPSHEARLNTPKDIQNQLPQRQKTPFQASSSTQSHIQGQGCGCDCDYQLSPRLETGLQASSSSQDQGQGCPCDCDCEGKEQIHQEKPQAKGSKKRKNYEPSFKQLVVECWQGNRNYLRTAAEINERHKSSIGESHVRRWTDELLTPAEKTRTLKKVKITTSKAFYSDLEKDLIQWIASQREKKLSVTLKGIQDKALEIFALYKESYLKETNFAIKQALEPYNTQNFGASRGWFSRFKKRFGLSRRVGTHVASKLAEDYAKEVNEFLSDVRNLR